MLGYQQCSANALQTLSKRSANTQRCSRPKTTSEDLDREMKPKFNKRSRNLDQNTRPKTTSEDLDREMDDYMKSQLIKAKRFLAS